MPRDMDMNALRVFYSLHPIHLCCCFSSHADRLVTDLYSNEQHVDDLRVEAAGRVFEPEIVSYVQISNTLIY